MVCQLPLLKLSLALCKTNINQTKNHGNQNYYLVGKYSNQHEPNHVIQYIMILSLANMGNILGVAKCIRMHQWELLLTFLLPNNLFQDD